MYEIARPGTGYGSSSRRYFGDGVCKESRVLNDPGLHLPETTVICNAPFDTPILLIHAAVVSKATIGVAES
jgi:hypothetical protein